MRSIVLLAMAAAACLSAQVKFTPHKQGSAVDSIAVTIDGKPFATYQYGADVNKPYLAPIRSASGKIITRRYPMEDLPGESRDHVHHNGLWFSYDDVNGVKFWENDPSYNDPKMGKIVVRGTEFKDGGKTGTLTTTNDWNAPDGKTLLVETRKMTFHSDPKLRTIDFDITLTASQNLTFGDTKEGAFAIRLVEAFTERKGAKLVDADGRKMMAQIWGKRSNWVDYDANLDGEQLGVAIFDHPSNPRHPTYWHARDYGLFALNPFGQQAFDPKAEESHWKLPAGQKLTFRWSLVIHPGDAESGHVADLYKQYSAH